MRWIHLVVVVVIVHCEQLLGVILDKSGQPAVLLDSWQFIRDIPLTDDDIDTSSGSPSNCQFEQIQGPETSLQIKFCYTGKDSRVPGKLA
ncbi:hypothetical protein IWQ61_010739, partial [Dispira simplex]